MKRPALSWIVIVLVLLGIRTSVPAQTHDHAAMSAEDGEFNPYVVSDNQGGFLLTFVQRKAGRSDILLQRSLGGGRFGTGIRVNDRAGDGAVRNENPPKIAVGRNNEIYVVWANERERWKGNIRFARSLNGGKSFDPAIDLNSVTSTAPVGRAFESIAVDANGRILVAWIDERNKTAKDRGTEIWMATSDDRGKTFSRDRKILSNVCECCRITLAVDSTGGIYVSFRTVPASGPMLRDIAVARSVDGGRTFQPSIVSHDGWELDGCPVAGPSMTVDGAGRIHIVWFTQSRELPKLYIASSSDRGSSFSKPVAFDPNQKLAKHAHAVAVANNRVLIAWDDLDGTSTVKWGLYDPTSRSMRFLGTQAGTSYPIIGMSENDLSLVALQPGRHEIFRTVQSVEAR